MLTLEKEIERAFCDWIWSRQLKTVKFSDPSRRGAPDRIVFNPFGYTYFVEFKRPTKDTTKHQKAYAKELNEMGYDVFLIDSYEKLNEFKKPNTNHLKFHLLDYVKS